MIAQFGEEREQQFGEEGLELMNLNDKFFQITDSLHQASSCLELASTLLERFVFMNGIIRHVSDPTPSRIDEVIFQRTPELLATLLAFLTINIPHGLSPQNTSAMVNIQVNALRTLAKFISTCSHDSNSADDEDKYVRNSINLLC